MQFSIRQQNSGKCQTEYNQVNELTISNLDGSYHTSWIFFLCKYIYINMQLQKKTISITIILILIHLSEIKSQIWQKTYGSPYSGELCFSSYSGYDEGFVIGSRLNERDIWIAKIDKNGILLNTHLIKSTNTDFRLTSTNKTKDGGVITTGSYAPIGSAWDYPFIVSLNSCAELNWCKKMDVTGYGFRIKETSLGNFVLYTRYASTVFQQESNQLWGIDSEGKINWYNQIVPTYEVLFNSALINDFAITSDKGFILTGYCYYPDASNPGWDNLQYLMVKTDSIGNAEWIQPNSTDTNNIGALYGCIQHNNAYYGVGFWYGHNDTIVPPCFNKYSLDGTLISSTLLHPDTLNNILNDIEIVDDTLLAMSGRCNHSYYGDLYTGVFTSDTLGSLYKSIQNKSGSSIEECLSISSDRKILCTGYTPINYQTLNQLDVFAIKLNANLEYDSVYTQAFTYDSLCPYPVVSDTIICNCEPFVSVKEAEESMEKITISPNPAKEWFTVGFPQSLQQAGNVNIYDMLGRVQYSGVLTPGQKQTKINGEGWKSGLYFVRCQTGGKVLNGKVVVR